MGLDLIALGALALRRLSPIRLDLSYLDQRRIASRIRRGVSAGTCNARQSIGKLGEATTAMLFIAEGWAQVPSKPHGVHGIDAIYVRKRPSHRSYEIAFVETKASLSGNPIGNYRGGMSAANLILDLERCVGSGLDGAGFMPAAVGGALKGAIRRKSPSVALYVYAHDIRAGLCLVHRVRRNGAASPRPIKTYRGERYASLVHALSIALG